MVVEKPEILKPCHALDFGPGFYTTLCRDQAVDFATAKALSFIRFKSSEVLA